MPHNTSGFLVMRPSQQLNITRMLFMSCGLLLSIMCMGPSLSSSQPFSEEQQVSHKTINCMSKQGLF